jgi:hypothetical protein
MCYPVQRQRLLETAFFRSLIHGFSAIQPSRPPDTKDVPGMKPPLRRRPRGTPGAPIENGPASAGPALPLPPLPLPHEGDQAVGETATEPDPIIEQAARDLKAGLVDTDLHGTPGMDYEQRRLLLQQQRTESEAAPQGDQGAHVKRRDA